METKGATFAGTAGHAYTYEVSATTGEQGTLPSHSWEGLHSFPSNEAAKGTLRRETAERVLQGGLRSLWFKLSRIDRTTGRAETILFVVMSPEAARAYLSASGRS